MSEKRSARSPTTGSISFAGSIEKEKLFCAAPCGGGSLQERNLILILTQKGHRLL
jgi:hypothetical protein